MEGTRQTLMIPEVRTDDSTRYLQVKQIEEELRTHDRVIDINNTGRL